MSIRVVAQAVESAKLLVDNVSRFVSIGPGVVLYVAFLNGCTDATVRLAVSSLATTRIFLLGVDRSADEASKAQGGPRAKPTSLVERPSTDVLVIPQATLAGKAKGKVVQYHQQIGKDEGHQLYHLFVDELRRTLLPQDVLMMPHDVNGVAVTTAQDGAGALEEGDGPAPPPPPRQHRQVLCGTYGNRQALSFDSEGPFSHSFEF